MENSNIKNSNKEVNTNTKNVLSKELIVADSGVRLDAYVANNMVELSRSMVQKLIKSGNILVNNKEENNKSQEEKDNNKEKEEPKEQKDLIRNILPNIEPEEAFNLLSDYDKAIIEKPIDNLSSYTDRINQEINSLEKEYNQNIGTISTLKSIALEQEGSLLKFDKENELKKLQDRYEDISLNFDISFSCNFI